MTRRGAVTALLLGLSIVTVGALVVLGNWQLRRLDWKLALIDAVESRAHGEPVPAPRGTIDPDTHRYRRVAISGRFLHRHSRFVKAVTELGPGYWVMTPLDTGSRHVWINRGFVPNARRASGRYAEPEDRVRIVGLVRITEPKGSLLQRNEPTEGRWYSRDVSALSRDAGIGAEPNWFIDAARDRTSANHRWPRAGLTRVDFRNPHLAYALTWYGMALALALAVAYVSRVEWRARRRT